MNDTIDLWLEDLSLSDDEYQHYWQLLDYSEQTKALRFVQDKHRCQYIASHGKLRTILASYVDIPPERLCFEIEEFGKPYLVLDGKAHAVTFNLSHSGNKMLLAVGYQCAIGIDIEVWNNKVDCALIADNCFAESERLYWQSLPHGEKDAVFYRFWTRKESFIKVVGAGLNLNVAEVISSGQGTARFLAIPSLYGREDDWRVLDLDVGRGISAALTVRNTHFNWQWRTNSVL